MAAGMQLLTLAAIVVAIPVNVALPEPECKDAKTVSLVYLVGGHTDYSHPPWNNIKVSLLTALPRKSFREEVRRRLEHRVPNILEYIMIVEQRSPTAEEISLHLCPADHKKLAPSALHNHYKYDVNSGYDPAWSVRQCTRGMAMPAGCVMLVAELDEPFDEVFLNDYLAIKNNWSRIHWYPAGRFEMYTFDRVLFPPIRRLHVLDVTQPENCHPIGDPIVRYHCGETFKDVEMAFVRSISAFSAINTTQVIPTMSGERNEHSTTRLEFSTHGPKTSLADPIALEGKNELNNTNVSTNTIAKATPAVGDLFPTKANETKTRQKLRKELKGEYTAELYPPDQNDIPGLNRQIFEPETLSSNEARPEPLPKLQEGNPHGKAMIGVAVAFFVLSIGLICGLWCLKVRRRRAMAKIPVAARYEESTEQLVY